MVGGVSKRHVQLQTLHLTQVCFLNRLINTDYSKEYAHCAQIVSAAVSTVVTWVPSVPTLLFSQLIKTSRQRQKLHLSF